MAKRSVYHSIKDKNGWKVVLDGKDLSRHDTQLEAEDRARKLGKAVQEKGGLGQAVFHRADGQIVEERTYGADPQKTKG
ncbi:DUF2188 domain-containing protein [Rhizobium sp. RCAM05350]|nr:DUF2188 domain-containing protein [Rhizobium sp. RCAM05350]